MKKLKEELKYGKKGITLISLVVTIIVLLILAGVTISALAGNNGILNQATKASKVTENAVETEEKRLDEYGNIIDSYIDNEKDSFVKIITAENYGDYVDYPIDINGDGNTTNDWKIFYNNGERIFLITADYILNNSSYLNNEATEMIAYTQGTYSLYWNPAPTTQTVSEETRTIFKQNWTDYTTYDNGKCVSTMLNTNNWKGFVNNNYANYAIGSPTIEMWVKSYNEKGYTPLYCNNTNLTGYYIGNSDTPTTTYYNITNDTNTGYLDTLYFPHDSSVDDCRGYWLASPANLNEKKILMVTYQGSLGNDNYNYSGWSVRPVVSLKSDILATKGENGIWTLSN